MLPPVGSYNPMVDQTRNSIAREISLDLKAPRFDEYSFNKMASRSPGAVYDVKDIRDVSY